jgi:hypothetical protein
MAAGDTLIKEIFGTFKGFIYRDLFYVVGGVSVCSQVLTRSISHLNIQGGLECIWHFWLMW